MAHGRHARRMRCRCAVSAVTRPATSAPSPQATRARPPAALPPAALPPWSRSIPTSTARSVRSSSQSIVEDATQAGEAKRDGARERLAADRYGGQAAAPRLAETRGHEVAYAARRARDSTGFMLPGIRALASAPRTPPEKSPPSQSGSRGSSRRQSPRVSSCERSRRTP